MFSRPRSFFKILLIIPIFIQFFMFLSLPSVCADAVQCLLWHFCVCVCIKQKKTEKMSNYFDYRHLLKPLRMNERVNEVARLATLLALQWIHGQFSDRSLYIIIICLKCNFINFVQSKWWLYLKYSIFWLINNKMKIYSATEKEKQRVTHSAHLRWYKWYG